MALLPVWDRPGEYFIPFKLLMLARMIERETSKDLNAFGITVAEWRVLSQCCARGSSSAAEICAAFEADRAEVSRAVASLVKSGYIRRTPDSSHRQKMRLSPTESGQAIFEGVRDVRSDFFHDISQDLTAEERATFNSALQRMALRLDERRTAKKSGDTANNAQ